LKELLDSGQRTMKQVDALLDQKKKPCFKIALSF